MYRLTAHQILDIPVYWVFFWNAVYILCPPRETFNSRGYNKFLDLVSYYGSLNIRSLIMKVYQAPPPDVNTPNPGPAPAVKP